MLKTITLSCAVIGIILLTVNFGSVSSSADFDMVEIVNEHTATSFALHDPTSSGNETDGVHQKLDFQSQPGDNSVQTQSGCWYECDPVYGWVYIGGTDGSKWVYKLLYWVCNLVCPV